MKRFLLVAGLALMGSFLALDNSLSRAQSGTGTLSLVANGEDFVRQGFVTKDGWRIDFDRVAVTLDKVVAYQTDPPFDPDSDSQMQVKTELVLVDAPKVVDLAAGGADAPPIAVVEKSAPVGFYNALAWTVTSRNRPAIVLDGTAKKGGRTIDFVLNLDTALAYTCGEFVGDDRKGFLRPDGTTELEATFHFDHIFGDGEAPADDEINTGAIGFEPLAQLARGNTMEADLSTLKSQLSPGDYQTLEKAIAGLGHVGEGHCQLGSGS